jgi:ATP-dependent DNA helicase RecQ
VPARAESSARRFSAKSGEIDCDEALFGKLRQLRRRLAAERGVPPFMVFSDVSLRHMACDYPATLEAFGRVHGVGARKLADFGEVFVAAIREHQESAPDAAGQEARKDGVGG